MIKEDQLLRIYISLFIDYYNSLLIWYMMFKELKQKTSKAVNSFRIINKLIYCTFVKQLNCFLISKV